MANRNMKADMNVQFTEASSRQSIESGESVKTLFGKIRKWLSDLKPVAFSGSYNDLSNKPTTGVSGVKGNSETTYRTGNVNLTPANIGAATSAQGTKADSAVQIIQINGTAQTKTDGTVNLPAYPTVNNGTLTIQKNGSNVATFTANQSGNTTANLSLSKSDVGLSNVNNTSDANKPISTATQAALDGKVNKSGDTMTGTLTHQASSVYLKATNLDLNGDNPSAFTWGNSEINFADKDGQRACFFNVGRRNTGGTQVSLAVRARNTTDTADIYNEFGIRAERDGTRSYVVTDPAAFRRAIGLNNLGYYGIGGRGTNSTTNPWVLVAETTGTITNNTAITLLFDYTYTPPVNDTSTGTGILSVNVRTDVNGAIVTDRSYAKWLIRTNELNNDDVVITYNNSTKSLQIWAKSDCAYKAFRVRPLSGDNIHSSFDISKWTFTTSLNTNMYESYPTGDGITVLTPTCDIQDQVNYNTNNGVKNLLKINIPETTARGLTLTPQSDGTIIVNGTSTTSSSYIIIWNLEVPTAASGNTQYSANRIGYGNFIMSLNAGESTDKAFALQCLAYADNTVSNPAVTSQTYFGNSINVTIPTDKKYVWFRILVEARSNGVTYNNYVLKPMIREATIEDSTFEPYAEPNYQLTQKVDKALEQTGYNLLEITAGTQTINGVTFIVDKEAGTITANGTATAQAECVINYGVGLPLNYEKELWSDGSPLGSAIDTYFLNYKDNKGKEANCYTNEPILPVNTTYPTKITRASICIRSGVTVSDLVFKPMIVPAELAGVPFQPYAKSNAELTSGKLDATGNAGTPYDQLPDRFELWTTGMLNYDTSLFIKMISRPSSKDRFLLLGNDDNMLYFGIEDDCFVVQTKDANSYYKFKDDGIYLNGTNVSTGAFRGKDLTNVYTIDQMYSMIHSGKFDDLFLGDYFTKSMTTDIYTRFTGASFASGTVYYEMGGTLTNRTWTETTDTTPQTGKVYATKTTKTENVTLMFAAFDYYYNVGDTALTTHHAVLIPRGYGFATAAKMNSSNTTVGSYFNSDMHQIVLPCYAKSLKTVLNNHLLAHRTILPNAINASTPSMAGAGFTGASNAWAWETVELQLMSEPQIYGTTVWSSSAFDVGADYKKLPVFDFINGVQFGRNAYWLRSVVSSTGFTPCDSGGGASNNGASNARYVRPLILFG